MKKLKRRDVSSEKVIFLSSRVLIAVWLNEVLMDGVTGLTNGSGIGVIFA